MKKLIIFLTIIGVLLMSSPVYAISISDLQKEIEILKQEIAGLKNQITGSVLGAVSPVTYSLGMKSPDLIKYQQALIDQKYLGAGNATGVFGLQTYTAVKNFQNAKGLKADGVLGVVTQSKLLGTDYATSLDGPELACLPNSWTRRADLPIYNSSFPNDAVSFNIGDKAYVGTGMSPAGGYSDFWEYNPSTNVWTQKANFGGGERLSAVGFSIKGLGYIGTGSLLVGGTRLSDFWSYNPLTNAWTRKADFPGGARFGAVGFSIGEKGYLGTGNTLPGGSTNYKKDFWEYDPSTDKWTQKSDFGGNPRFDGVGFNIGSKGYIGTGQGVSLGSLVLYKDFWEYDQSTDKWTQKSDFGGDARFSAVGFGSNNYGYLGTGTVKIEGSYKTMKDFWEYNPTTNKWIQKSNFGGGERSGATGFAVGSRGYLGTGLTKDIWMYCPGQSN